MLIDTHCHLNFAAYKDDLKEVVERTLHDEMKVINVGSQYSTSERAVKLAAEFPGQLYAAIGLHPIHLFEMHVDEGEFDVHFTSRKEEFRSEAYEELAQRPGVVAIGEMGIDYFHVPEGVAKREFEIKQKWTFTKGVQLAKKLGLPVIMHCRGSKELPDKAYLDMLAVLRHEQYFNCVVHCFTSTWEIAKKFLDAGCMISFTGIITYPKTKALEQVVKKTPLDRLMVETDAPYLAPQIVRGQRNEPRFVRYVADRVAEIKKLSFEKVEEQTTENARRFFRIG